MKFVWRNLWMDLNVINYLSQMTFHCDLLGEPSSRYIHLAVPRLLNVSLDTLDGDVPYTLNCVWCRSWRKLVLLSSFLSDRKCGVEAIRGMTLRRQASINSWTFEPWNISINLSYSSLNQSRRHEILFNFRSKPGEVVTPLSLNVQVLDDNAH